MEVKVIGMRNVNFVDNRSGATITGFTFYCVRKDANVIGVEGKKFFINSSINVADISINDIIKVYFNEKGKVESVEKIGSAK